MSAGFSTGAPSCARPARREIDVTLNDAVVDLTTPEITPAEPVGPTFADLPLGPELLRAVPRWHTTAALGRVLEHVHRGRILAVEGMEGGRRSRTALAGTAHGTRRRNGAFRRLHPLDVDGVVVDRDPKAVYV